MVFILSEFVSYQLVSFVFNLTTSFSNSFNLYLLVTDSLVFLSSANVFSLHSRRILLQEPSLAFLMFDFCFCHFEFLCCLLDSKVADKQIAKRFTFLLSVDNILFFFGYLDFFLFLWFCVVLSVMPRYGSPHFFPFECFYGS